jgi:hypothetical protein
MLRISAIIFLHVSLDLGTLLRNQNGYNFSWGGKFFKEPLILNEREQVYLNERVDAAGTQDILPY